MKPPEAHADVIIETTFNQLALGHYQGSGQYKIVTRKELNDDGGYDDFYGTIHKSYVKRWSYIEFDECDHIGSATTSNGVICDLCGDCF